MRSRFRSLDASDGSFARCNASSQRDSVPVLLLVCQCASLPVCVRQIVASLTFASHPACSTKAAPVLSVRQDSGTSSFSSPNNFHCSPNRNSYKKHDVLRMRIVFVQCVSQGVNVLQCTPCQFGVSSVLEVELTAMWSIW